MRMTASKKHFHFTAKHIPSGCFVQYKYPTCHPSEKETEKQWMPRHGLRQHEKVRKSFFYLKCQGKNNSTKTDDHL